MVMSVPPSAASDPSSVSNCRVVPSRRVSVGRERDPSRSVEVDEHVPVAVQPLGRRAEADRPDAADADVALGSNDPASVVLAIESELAAGARESVDDHVGRRRDDALVAHRSVHFIRSEQPCGNSYCRWRCPSMAS
jgi:hypothetical protein